MVKNFIKNFESQARLDKKLVEFARRLWKVKLF